MHEDPLKIESEGNIKIESNDNCYEIFQDPIKIETGESESLIKSEPLDKQEIAPANSKLNSIQIGQTPSKASTSKQKCYKCDIGVRSFDSSRNLKLHNSAKHSKIKKPIISCDICHRKFTNISLLKKHYSRTCKFKTM